MRALLPFLLLSLQALAQSPSLPDLARTKNFTAHRVSSGNRFINSNDDSKRIMPGESFVMADLDGPGVVSHIWLTVADNEYAWQRLVRLRVYYDNRKTPSIDVPLGDFFGVGHGYDRNLDSMMIRNSSFGRARNSYWPMPFRKHCRITVTDEGNRPVTMFYYQVDWQKHPSLPADIGYLHAYYRQERPAVKGRNYAFLDTKGSGHYVGTVLNVIQADIGWFGEGDDLFYIDGAKNPQILGTGTEDYVNEAWGLRVSTGPWAGTPVAEGELVGARLTGYRWHVPDPIPFTKSIWAGIEHAGWTYNADGSLRSGFEERPDYFSSTAFWYQTEINETLPEPPYGDARLPLGNAQQIAVEDSLADVTTVAGKASVQREVDWGRDLLFFEPADPVNAKGARLNVPLDIRKTDRYEILARIAQAPDYGDYTVLLDDKLINVDNRQAATSEIPNTAPPVIHNYLPEVYVAVEVPLGWVNLTQGRHTLSFICTGKDSRSSGFNFGLNDVILQRVPVNEPDESLPALPKTSTGPTYRGVSLAAYLNEFRRTGPAHKAALLRAIGNFGKDAAPAVNDIAQALASPDPAVRTAAAWALSQMSDAATGAVAALEKTLADPQANVRSLSAIALRALGRNAAKAIPGLTKALDDSSAYVRALAADAIGNIGPAATPVVPALTAHLSAPNEQVFVMRSIATALGNIGSKQALPALEQALKLPRVIYTAEEAIHKIKGEPVRTWY